MTDDERIERQIQHDLTDPQLEDIVYEECEYCGEEFPEYALENWLCEECRNEKSCEENEVE